MALELGHHFGDTKRGAGRPGSPAFRLRLSVATRIPVRPGPGQAHRIEVVASNRVARVPAALAQAQAPNPTYRALSFYARYSTPMNVLAVSGSLRQASSNTNVLRALRVVGPAGIEVVLHPLLDPLPFFNPDIEEAGPPSAVEAWRSQIRAHDALVISSPEYAHGVSGVLKNALDWLVGGVEIGGKPIAVINAMPRTTIAHAALVEGLHVMGGRVVEQASLPVAGRKLDADGIAADAELSTRLRSVLSSLARAAAEPSVDQESPA